MWKHLACNTEIVSELWASDTENDYYIPVCPKCMCGVEKEDMYFVEELGKE